MYIISYILLYSRFLFGMISLRIDKAFYGEWTLVPLNFFTFNISKKMSHIYGEYWKTTCHTSTVSIERPRVTHLRWVLKDHVLL